MDKGECAELADAGIVLSDEEIGDRRQEYGEADCCEGGLFFGGLA